MVSSPSRPNTACSRRRRVKSCGAAAAEAGALGGSSTTLEGERSRKPVRVDAVEVASRTFPLLAPSHPYRFA